MGSMSIWHWIIVLAVGLLLFGGRGKISELMGDMAKGIKAFKKGMTEDEKAEADAPKPAESVRTIDHLPQSATTTPAQTAEMNKRSDTERKFEGGTV